MAGTSGQGMIYRGIAVVAGCATILVLGFSSQIPLVLGGLVALGGVVLAAGVLYFGAGKGVLKTREEHVSTEFRREVERYLSEVSSSGGRPRRGEVRIEMPPEETGSDQSAVPSTGEQVSKDVEIYNDSPPVHALEGDVLGRITENVEVLGGYREDLVALLQLYRSLQDPARSPAQNEKTIKEIRRFEKTIALPFVLDDSRTVQSETTGLVGDLRRWLRHGAVDEKSGESWTPVDLHSRIEMVLEELPHEQARVTWFERHYGEVPLLLTRPEELNRSLQLIMLYFVDKIGASQAIHIRTAQRGEYAWIGVGAAPTEVSAEELSSDEQIIKANRIWNDLGGHMVTGENEVRLLVPLHGPVHLYAEEAGEAGEAGENAEEKTG